MEKHWGGDRKESPRPGTPDPGGPKDSGCVSLGQDKVWAASATEAWASCLGEWAEARATGLRRGSRLGGAGTFGTTQGAWEKQ